MSEPAVPHPAPSAAAVPRPARVFYGWWIVLCSWVGDFFSIGISFYSFGLFFKPMSDELGWSRGALSFALTLRSLVNIGLGPVVGHILDKWGPRLLMAVGGVAAGLGLLALSRVHSLLQFYLIFGVLWAVGFGTISGLVTTTTVSKWFVRKRGRAIAIETTGISIGGIVLTQLTAFLIGHYDWRTAWFVLGVLVLAFVVPLALLLMRRQPEDLGLLPDGETAAAGARAQPAPAQGRRWWPHRRKVQEQDFTLRQAVHTRSLWLLIAATNLSSIALSTITLHQVPLVQDRGLSAAAAAVVVTLFAVGSLAAKIIWGLAAEFVPLRFLSACNYLGASGAMLILFGVHSASVGFIYGAVAGVTMGGMPVLQNLLWPEYFGRASLGTIRGAFAPIGALTSGFGPFLGGVLYDATGGYTAMLIMMIGTSAAAGMLMVLARPPRAPTPVS